MFVLLKECVEVCDKESNVTAVLCCLRLVIFFFSCRENNFFSGAAFVPAALELLLEGGRCISGWAVHLINMHCS
jgi:hypothetical protein